MMLVLLMVMNIDCYFDEEGDDDDGDVGKLSGTSSLFIV